MQLGSHHGVPLQAALETTRALLKRTYQRVLLPVSVALSYSGREGMTVGMGETELVAAEVAVAKA